MSSRMTFFSKRLETPIIEWMTLLDSGVAMGWGTIHEVVGEFTLMNAKGWSVYLWL